MLIKTIGVNNTAVNCKGWLGTNVNVTVVEDGHIPIIFRYSFPQLVFSPTQSKQVLNINQKQGLINKQIALDFPGLIFRIDFDTIPVEDYLDNNGWQTGE